MKRKTTVWFYAETIVLLATMGLISGCIIPYPHLNSTSPTISGRVLNAYSGEPVERVKIFLTEKPGHLTKTDSLGYFRLRERNKFHLFMVVAACPPSEDTFTWQITLTHPEYSSEGMYVTTNSEYFLMPTNKAEYIKQGLKPVYLLTNSPPVRY